jgi:hypothetical protein
MITAVDGVGPHYQWGKWSVFLTLWGQFTQANYFTFAVLVDLLYMSGNPRINHIAETLRRHRDRWFTLCFGLGNVIGTVFWCIIFPHSVAACTSSGFVFFLQFFAHGITTIAIWTELFVTYHKYGSKILEVILLLCFGAAYMGWTQVCYHFNHVWPYFFMDNLSDVVYWSLTGGIAIMAVIMYFLGRIITHFFWKSRQDYTGAGRSDVVGLHVLNGDYYGGHGMNVHSGKTISYGTYGDVVEP